MKRSVIILSLFALVVLAACATTTPATPDLTGTVTAIDASAITIKPATGDTTTVKVSRATQLSWYNGIDAIESDVVVGHRVNVWLNPGTQNAAKLVITQ